MEVILSKDVDRIGKAGQIVKVKDGYARNFLFPNGLAVTANSESLKKLELERQKKALQSEKEKKQAQEISDKLSRISLTIPVLTHEQEKLYASITAQDLSAGLKDEGFEIDKDSFVLDEPIKALGIYEVPVKLHPDVLAKIKVWIVKK
ncbi:MAG: 50S ribosomal protein L9 [Candidatus Omnitrophica bacterium]|nr:50S ribosomal protein L9 [Candidatus Omnitrophota bacterium]MDD5552607.1 50S ribosomal protein L9 [Candidatus Omnitrophota bacterium]